MNNSPQSIYIVAQQNSGLAIASLVFGILSILGLAFCGAFLVAIITGHMALSQIKRSGGTIGGRGMAIAGLILGYIPGAIAISIIVFMMLTGGIMQSKIQSDIKKERSRQEELIENYSIKYDEFVGRYKWTKGDDDDQFFDVVKSENYQLIMNLPSGEKCVLSPKLAALDNNGIEYNVSGCLQNLRRKPQGAYFDDEAGKISMVFWFDGEFGNGRSRFPKVE